MSSYTSSTSAVQANAAALKIAIPGFERAQDALIDGLTSTRLADIRDNIDQAVVLTVDDLSGLWQQVGRGLPTLTQSFSDATYEELASAESQLESIRSSVFDGAASAELAVHDVHASLVGALDAAHREFAHAEQMLAAEATAHALPDLGYVVTRVDGDDGDGVTAFEASRGHEKLLVAVSKGGEVVTDHVGLSDAASCGTAQQDFADRLEHYGLSLTETNRFDHRDPRGGALAVHAARQGAQNLAEGVVKAIASGAVRRPALVQAPRRTMKEVG